MINRKSASAMTAAEQTRYVTMIDKLNSGPHPTAYGEFVGIHGEMNHHMHTGMGGGAIGRQRFLPWHRDFLLKFEKAMQAIDPLAFVPYWDWTVDRAIPAWMAGITPTVMVPATSMSSPQNVQVVRNPSLPAGLPTAGQIDTLDQNTTMKYTQFTSHLEGFHNIVHSWVGGTMNDIMVSPADPIFWMHHAQVDRLWSIWQANPANANKHPLVAGSNAVLDPWGPDTVTGVASIAALGYQYV